MTTQFRSLVLLPTIFLVVLFGALLGGNSPAAYVLLIATLIEHIYYWNQSVEQKKYPDFRVFFSDQYLKLVYELITFGLFFISSIFWDQINWWILFGYALNYLIFRSLAQTGTEQISELPSVKSKPIKSDFDLWSSNKERLTLILDRCTDITLQREITDQINFSAFLRTEQAAKLINEADRSSGESLILILKSIASSM